MTPDALLEEILAHPDDDGPRLVWADAVGGERGELVVIQCELARGNRSPELRRRNRELLLLHGGPWAGLAGIARSCRFHRGFPAIATIDSSDCHHHFDRLFAIAPMLTTVEISSWAMDRFELLVDLPAWRNVRGLALGAVSPATLSDLAKRRAFEQLRSVRFGQLELDAATTLAATQQLAHVTRLAVPSHNFTALAIPRLLATMPALRMIDLRGHVSPDSLFDVLPRSLTEIAISIYALGAFSTSPLAATLERLSIHDVEDPATLAHLAAFPRLRSLDIGARSKFELDANVADKLHLPSTLRELRCDNVSSKAAHVLATRFGPQLDLLELTGYKEPLDGLVPLVAGDVFANPIGGSYLPMFVGDYPLAPMWDYPYVRY